MARSLFIPVCLIFIVANEVNFLSAMPALAPESEAPLSRNVRAVSLPQGNYIFTYNTFVSSQDYCLNVRSKVCTKSL